MKIELSTTGSEISWLIVDPANPAIPGVTPGYSGTAASLAAAVEDASRAMRKLLVDRASAATADAAAWK